MGREERVDVSKRSEEINRQLMVGLGGMPSRTKTRRKEKANASCENFSSAMTTAITIPANRKDSATARYESSQWLKSEHCRTKPQPAIAATNSTRDLVLFSCFLAAVGQDNAISASPLSRRGTECTVNPLAILFNLRARGGLVPHAAALAGIQ